MDNSQFDNSDIKPKKTETVYTCDNCPHAGNLMCCHNCPNFSNFVDDESIVNRTKAQRYDEVVKKVKDYYEGKTKMYSDVKQTLDLLFPEFKEKDSEDDRARKAILAGLIDCRDAPDLGWSDFGGINIDECIAWLEKQCEQKPYGQRKECEDCQFNYAGEYKGHCQMKKDEQKPTDNVEPKFKVGDWVVYDHRPYQVVELPKEGYINLGLRRNGKVEFAPSPYCRHWTIADAKDGDVLVASDGSIFLFAGVDDCACKYYVALNYVKININKEAKGGYWETSRAVHPATKEQRDTLIEAMTNAGYTFDFEKKELKKAESKTLDPDKVIEWLNDQACQGWIEDVEVDKFVNKFKRDFGI